MDSKAFEIIIVDDDPVIRFYTSLCMTEVGFSCVEAGNGQEAIDKLASMNPLSLPRVALVDVRMPILDGFGFVAEAKRRKYLESMEVIFVTSEVLAREVTIEGKSFRVLSKPYNLDELVMNLKKIIPLKMSHIPKGGSSESSTGTSPEL